VRHWLFNLVAALSLLLCATTLVFWYRSDTVGDDIRWYRPPRIFEIFSTDGVMCISYGSLISLDYPPPSGWEISFWPFHRRVDSISGDLRSGTTLGFRYERSRVYKPRVRIDGRSVTFPYWLPAVCFAFLPALTAVKFWRARARRRREAEGLCSGCGYNLTGNTSGVCPECGAQVPEKPEART
jgi:hypothetical protein